MNLFLQILHHQQDFISIIYLLEHLLFHYLHHQQMQRTLQVYLLLAVAVVVDILVAYRAGGGGGAGGLLKRTGPQLGISAGDYTVVVGAGGKEWDGILLTQMVKIL